MELLYFYEIFLGGGGRIFQYKGFVLRYIIFFYFVFLTFFKVIFNKSYRYKINNYDIIVLANIAYLLFFVLISLLLNRGFSNVLNDVKPYIYLFMYFPLKKIVRVVGTKKIFKILFQSMIIISVLSISIRGLIIFKFYEISELRIIIENIILGFEIGLRSNGAVFYTGHVILIYGSNIIFNKMLYDKTTKMEKIGLILSICTILISDTRGAIISLFLSFLFSGMYFCFKKSKKITLVFLLIFNILAVNILMYKLRVLSEARNFSNLKRVTFIKELSEYFTNDIFKIFGSGFGSVFGSSYFSRLEISYLEILFKLGIIGLILYLMMPANILLKIFGTNKKNVEKESVRYGIGFGIISLLILTATNPYINNPIGISLIFISYYILKEKRRECFYDK